MPGAPEREERFRRLVTADVYDALWRFACRLSGTREDAEDLLQETLARGFERLHQLRDEALAKGWLFSIMRRLRLNRVGRQQDAGAGAVADLPDAPAGNPGPGRGLAEDVRQVVGQLPAAQREAIELFHFEGLSIHETAAALGVSANNVKQRLWRARQTLLSQLQGSLRAGELEEMF